MWPAVTYVREKLLGPPRKAAAAPKPGARDWFAIADPAYQPPQESAHPPSPQDLEPNRRAIYHIRHGEYGEAAVVLKSAAAAEPDDPLQRVAILMNLGTVNRLLNGHAAARQALEAALSAARKLPDGALFEARILDQMGDVEAAERKLPVAIRYYRQALAFKESAPGGSGWETAVTLQKLGELYFREHRYNEADAEFTRALRITGSLAGWEHAAVAKQLQRLAHVYARQRKHGQAEQTVQFALRLLATERSPEDPEVIACLRMLSGSYRGLGRYADAQTVLALTERILDHSATRQEVRKYEAPRPPGPADYEMKDSPLHRDTM